MLDVRRLQALQAVVATGSVREAAAELGYTASAVSQHVAALARETGTALLEPAGRGVRPTAAGRLLAEHAEVILSGLAAADASLEALKAGELGVLRLASFHTAGAALVPSALVSFRSSLPGMAVDLRVNQERHESLAKLRKGEVDIAVIEAHEGDLDELRAIVPPPTYLLADPYRVVMSRRHPLARRRVLELQELAGEAWIDVLCQQGCCCGQVTDAAFRRAGYAPRTAIEADEFWAAQGFVAAGLGLALMPTLALASLHEGVVARRLRPSSEPVRHVFAVVRPSVADTVPVRTMLAVLQAAAVVHAGTLEGPQPASLSL